MGIQICTLVLALLNFMTLSSFMIIMAVGARETKKTETKKAIKEAWDATLNEDAQKRSDEIMVTMSEEIEALAKKDKDKKDAEKESNEIEQILTAQMAAYKEAMDNTFTAIMEGTDE